MAAWLGRAWPLANSLAVPFLENEDEDDYELLPPRSLSTLQLMGITFFAVSGSAYGIEELVPAAGPFVALAMLVLAALLWSAPMLMVTSELSIRLPKSGGYIIWIHTAFGPLLPMLNGISNSLCNVCDCSIYPLLLTKYLQRSSLPSLLSTDPGSTRLPDADDSTADLAGAALRILFVGAAALVNIRGVDLVGSAARSMMLLVSLPFAALVVCAVFSPRTNSGSWFDSNDSLWPATREDWYFAGVLVLWNSCGYDSAGMVAAEVVSPARAFPLSLCGALLLSTLLYVAPLAAAVATVGGWEDWKAGQFVDISAQVVCSV